MSQFDINDLNKRASDDTEANYSKVTGPDHAQPGERFTVRGAQKGAMGERIRGALVGPQTASIVAATVLLGIGAAYIGNSFMDNVTYGSRALSTYDEVKAPASSLSKMGDMNFGELVGSGYVDLASSQPVGNDWSGVTFTGKDGLMEAADLKRPEVLGAIKETLAREKMETLITAIQVDWAVIRDRADDKGYGLDDYVKIATEGTIEEARAWSATNFSEEIGKRYDILPDASADKSAEAPSGKVTSSHVISEMRALQAASRHEPASEPEPERAVEDDSPRPD